MNSSKAASVNGFTKKIAILHLASPEHIPDESSKPYSLANNTKNIFIKLRTATPKDLIQYKESLTGIIGWYNNLQASFV